MNCVMGNIITYTNILRHFIFCKNLLYETLSLNPLLSHCYNSSKYSLEWLIRLINSLLILKFLSLSHIFFLIAMPLVKIKIYYTIHSTEKIKWKLCCLIYIFKMNTINKQKQICYILMEEYNICLKNN